LNGPETNAIPYARADLRVRDATEMSIDPTFKPVLILGCNRTTINPSFFPGAPVIWTVQREGVPLTVVKLLTTPQSAIP
jgi:hypothetical protein